MNQPNQSLRKPFAKPTVEVSQSLLREWLTQGQAPAAPAKPVPPAPAKLAPSLRRFR